jgi:hypothetical protein
VGWLAIVPRILPVISMAVGMVERMATAKKGKDKQDEAVTIVTQFAPLIGGGLDLLLPEDDVQKALRDLIDAVVRLQNAARDARAKRAA